MSSPHVDLRHAGDLLVASLRGDIDVGNVAVVAAVVLDAGASDPVGVVVDLTSTRYIDSAGVNMLFDLARELAVRRQLMAVAVPDDSPVRSLVKLTNLHEAVMVMPTVDEALAALLQQGEGFA
jgi:anti-anti-sigma factor